MINKLKISNFKSIIDLELDLSKVNVFIGENGCGKSNILEAVGMLAAAKTDDLAPDELFNRGIRIAKPKLTINSFSNKKVIMAVKLEAKYQMENNVYDIGCDLIAGDYNEIFTKWIDDKRHSDIISLALNDKKTFENFFDKFERTYQKENPDLDLSYKNSDFRNRFAESFAIYAQREFKPQFHDYLKNYIIYCTNTAALRGIANNSHKHPLGINGEGLDVLIQSFDKKELEKLNSFKFINWLKNIEIDELDFNKHKGHKLGRSTSRLYFTDKYMKRDNNLFSAENANEGALHVLFYLALFISKKTPQFFAIDNIETALNPKLCRDLMQAIAGLALENDKQVLITTHNPAILDGMNLNDPNQKLFVVKRRDDGQTAVDEVKMKPETNEKYKLSELWMRGHIGGLPNNF